MPWAALFRDAILELLKRAPSVVIAGLVGLGTLIVALRSIRTDRSKRLRVRVRVKPKRSSGRQSLLPRATSVLEKLLQNQVAIVGVFMVLLAASYAGAEYAKDNGFVGYLTLEFQFEGAEDGTFGGVLVQAYRGDATTPQAVARVDQTGYFTFNDLYRDLYRFVAIRLTEDATEAELSSFSRNLRADEHELRQLPIFPATRRAARRLQTVHFDSNVAAISAQDQLQIGPQIETAARSTDYVIFIGNADDVGRDDANVSLGVRRAEAVRRAMGEGDGGEPSGLVLSFGEFWPAAKGQDVKSRALNRRVEVIAVESSLETVSPLAKTVDPLAVAKPLVYEILPTLKK